VSSRLAKHHGRREGDRRDRDEFDLHELPLKFNNVDPAYGVRPKLPIDKQGVDRCEVRRSIDHASLDRT
jgi:hypothetical protein